MDKNCNIVEFLHLLLLWYWLVLYQSEEILMFVLLNCFGVLWHCFVLHCCYFRFWSIAHTNGLVMYCAADSCNIGCSCVVYCECFCAQMLELVVNNRCHGTSCAVCSWENVLNWFIISQHSAEVYYTEIGFWLPVLLVFDFIPFSRFFFFFYVWHCFLCRRGRIIFFATNQS
jgi:hypothetical protein